jgi:hypothetical protein
MDSHGKEPTWFGRTLSEISAFQGSLYQPPQTTSDTTDWPSPWGPTDSEAAEIEKRTREARIRAHEEHDIGTNGPNGPQFEGNEVTAKGAETNQEKVAMPGNVPSGTDLNARRWEDIDIVFLSEFKVQITINSQPQPPQNYAEMGFENKKNKNPVAAWETLREGTEVTCPWHDAVFDITTGSVLGAPAPRDVTRYPVRVDGDDIEVEL